MYLLKGIGGIPVGHSETTLLVLALKHGYVMPEVLLEVHEYQGIIYHGLKS